VGQLGGIVEELQSNIHDSFTSSGSNRRSTFQRDQQELSQNQGWQLPRNSLFKKYYDENKKPREKNRQTQSELLIDCIKNDSTGLLQRDANRQSKNSEQFSLLSNNPY
jgi:hypothetical protein